MRPRLALLWLLLLLLLLLSLAEAAGAQCQLDIAARRPGDGLELRRCPDPQATRPGWFGIGWSSPFEARLIALADGSAVVRENGGWRHYGALAPAEAGKSAQAIARRAAEREGLDAGAEGLLAEQLATSAELRAQRMLAYGMHHPLLGLHRLAAADCPQGELRPDRAGTTRIGCDGSEDRFSADGLLLTRRLASGQPIEVVRLNGRPLQLRDRQGRAIQLSWDAQGRIEAARDDQGQSRHYRYDAQQRLSVLPP